MEKRVYWVAMAMVSIFALSCSVKQEKTINAKVIGLDSGKVYMSFWVSPDSARTDSIEFKNGKFSFRSPLEESTLCKLEVFDAPFGVLGFGTNGVDLLVGGEDLNLEIQVTDTMTVLLPVANSIQNTHWSKLREEMSPLKSKIEWNYEQMDREDISEDQTDSLYQASNILFEQMDTIIRHYARNNPAAIAPLFVVLAQGLSPDKVDFYEQLLKQSAPAHEKSIAAENIRLFVGRAKRTAIAQPSPEFSLPNPQGLQIALSSLRGRYVLVDFWASWCGPCRQESPNLVAAFREFQNRGFTILSVSIDRDREAWLQAFAKDGYTWTNVIDASGKVATEYNVMAIPNNLLLDKNGVIIAKDLRGEQLRQALEKHIGVVAN